MTNKPVLQTAEFLCFLSRTWIQFRSHTQQVKTCIPCNGCIQQTPMVSKGLISTGLWSHLSAQLFTFHKVKREHFVFHSIQHEVCFVIFLRTLAKYMHQSAIFTTRACKLRLLDQSLTKTVVQLRHAAEPFLLGRQTLQLRLHTIQSSHLHKCKLHCIPHHTPLAHLVQQLGPSFSLCFLEAFTRDSKWHLSTQ